MSVSTLARTQQRVPEGKEKGRSQLSGEEGMEKRGQANQKQGKCYKEVGWEENRKLDKKWKGKKDQELKSHWAPVGLLVYLLFLETHNFQCPQRAGSFKVNLDVSWLASMSL